MRVPHIHAILITSIAAHGSKKASLLATLCAFAYTYIYIYTLLPLSPLPVRGGKHYSREYLHLICLIIIYARIVWSPTTTTTPSKHATLHSTFMKYQVQQKDLLRIKVDAVCVSKPNAKFVSDRWEY